MTNKEQLDQAISRAISGESLIKGNNMDTQKKLDEAQAKIEEANQKLVDTRPGNVVPIISAFGTPSTYEDARHPDSQSVAQLKETPEKGNVQHQRVDFDKESLEKAQVEAADEAVKTAEATLAAAESEESVDEDVVREQQAEVREQQLKANGQQNNAKS